MGGIVDEYSTKTPPIRPKNSVGYGCQRETILKLEMRREEQKKEEESVKLTG
jgi:hypothetical protein